MCLTRLTTVILSIQYLSIMCHFIPETPKLAYPMSVTTMKELGEEVCFDLQSIGGWEESEFKNCRRAFLEKSENLPELGPRAKPICSEERLLLISVEPNSKYITVVVLQLLNDTNYYYSVLKPNESLARLNPYTRGTVEYRIWTAFVEPLGRASGWRMIQDIGNFENENVANFTEKSYDLRRVGNFSYENRTISAIFQWNATNECDIKVSSRCDKPVNRIGLLPVIINLENSTVIAKNLTLDSTCTLTLYGKGGRHETFSYVVPDRLDFLDNDQYVPYPPKILDVTTASSNNSKAIDVTVKWAPPKHRPTAYNVTLHRDPPITIVLPGNATVATFPNVTGSDFVMSVSAVTAAGVGTAVQYTRHYPRRRVASLWLVWTCASAGVACAALLAVAVAAVLRPPRRRKGFAPSPLYSGDIAKKLPKEDSLENFITVPIIEDEWEVHPERLLLQELLGEGAFGIVRKAKLVPSNKLVAVKMLKEQPSVEERRQMQAEMELMKNVGHHPNVVSLVGCCSGRRPMLIVEYCNRGDLLNYLRSAWDLLVWKRNAEYSNNNGEHKEKLLKNNFDAGNVALNKLYEIRGVCDIDLTPADLLSFCRQIARGMEFLAYNRIVHRDLAARNILVCADKTLKIADFGLSRDVYNESHYKQKSNGKLPIKWMAIESLVHQIYTSQSDVWSFGVVLWEVVTLGGTPYPGLPPARLLRFLRSGYRMPRPANCTEQLYGVMSSCWQTRPRDRPTFTELQHRLDVLLADASANSYLALEVDNSRDEPTLNASSYFKFLRSKLHEWTNRSEAYERPLPHVNSNYYTSPPGPRP